jgi:DNA polymerase III subunit gamma/tau
MPAAGASLTAGTPHQALYRRWRAQTFSEIVGQEAVVATLRNAVATGQVAHAVLFTGPRGTGKTSLARILAKALNCENLGPTADPCDACPSCVAIREGTTLDVLEIDAASNRGIDNIRDLRERIPYPPGQLRRKVYILDEAHQITKDAWNALLKSLEEPPDFVSFMFASTHPQGFPPAILSRLQRFDVRRLTVPEISGKLERILAADGREADPDAIAVISRLAAGGMRDAESILDQLLGSTAGRIEADAVRNLLGLADGELVDGFTAALAAGDAAAGVLLLDRLEERGRDLRVFLDQVVDALRERLLASLATAGTADPGVAAAARRLAAIDPTRLGPGGLRLQLELALLEPGIAAAALPASTRSTEAPAVRPTPATAPPAAPPAAREPGRSGPERSAARPAEPSVPAEPIANAAEPAARPAEPAPPATPAILAPTPAPISAAGATTGDDLDRLRRGWREVSAVISRKPALKPLIDAARPIGVDGAIVTIGFPEEKEFLRAIAESKRSSMEQVIGQYLGRDVSLRCVVANLDLLPPLPDDQEAERILAEANRIFADDRLDVPEVT